MFGYCKRIRNIVFKFLWFCAVQYNCKCFGRTK